MTHSQVQRSLSVRNWYPNSREGALQVANRASPPLRTGHCVFRPQYRPSSANILSVHRWSRPVLSFISSNSANTFNGRSPQTSSWESLRQVMCVEDACVWIGWNRWVRFRVKDAGGLGMWVSLSQRNPSRQIPHPIKDSKPLEMGFETDVRET